MTPRATWLQLAATPLIRGENDDEQHLIVSSGGGGFRCVWKNKALILIRGGPIFSVSNGGDDDHAMNTAEMYDDEVDDNLYDATKSLDWFLSPMQQLSTLQDIRNSTHLRT
jgi:hypothetical protein